MAPPPPGPYSGVSQLALVARASAFAFGVVYGNMKLKYLKWIPLFLIVICLACVAPVFVSKRKPGSSC